MLNDGRQVDGSAEESVTESATYQYRAFLSYRHVDAKWATWLHGRIGGFQIDKDFVGPDTLLGRCRARYGRFFATGKISPVDMTWPRRP